MRAQLSLAVAIVMALPAIGLAQPSEFQQRTACMSDAMRLCFWSIPDRTKIIRCMAGQRDQLTPDCRVVFDASSGPGKLDTITH